MQVLEDLRQGGELEVVELDRLARRQLAGAAAVAASVGVPVPRYTS